MSQGVDELACESVDPCCKGCGLVFEEGNVVSFGDGIWHVDCFRCAKCQSLVEHDSNLLLLLNGSPVCENCSYTCRVCKKPILNEAISTGDESFHVECFCCRSCQRKIEDLVFAKTSQGIYCMPCHNERVNKMRVKQKEQKPIPQSSLDKSLPSIPQERKQDNLQPPNRTINPRRSFDRPINSHSVTPKSSSESIQKAQTLPPSGPGIGRRTSRLFDASSFGDVLKNKVSASASKALEQFTGKTVEKNRARSESTDSTKKAGLFSKTNESLDNLTKMWSARHRGDSIDSHSRTSSITSSRSDPLYDGSGRSFSLTSQKSDILDIFHRRPGAHSTHGQDRNTESDLNRKHKKSPTTNFTQQQNTLSNIEEVAPAATSSQATVTQTSPNRSSLSSPDTPRSGSPSTPSSSPTSTRGPPSPTNSSDMMNFLPISGDLGPPTLPPLPFSDGDDLSKLVTNTKPNETLFNRKERQGSMETIEESNGIDSKDSGDETSGGSPLSSHASDRKNSESSINSSGRESDAPTVNIELELLNTKKDLAQAESSLRKMKRISQRALSEYSEEYNNEVSLRKEAERDVEKLRVEVALRNQHIAALTEEKQEMEQMLKDSKVTKEQLEEMQSTIKELDVKKELIINEIEGLAKEKQAGLAGTLTSTSQSAKDLPETLARHISTHLDQVKQNYLVEITMLQTERDSLKKETEQLRSTRDQYVEEAHHLHAKNLELTEINNELTRQIESGTKAKGHNGFHFFRGNKLLNEIQPPWHAPGHSSSVSIHSIDSQNSDYAKIVQRGNSVGGNRETPRKLKWKGGNMLNKLLSNNNIIPENKPPAASSSMPLVTPPTENLFNTQTDSRPAEVPSKIMASLLVLQQEQRKISGELGQRVHNWQQVSFSKQVKCEYCQEKMKSLVEMRCTVCGICSHIRCTNSISSNCNGIYSDSEFDEMVNVTMIFGNDLAKQLESEGREIPYVVQKCIDSVEVRGMDFEGIYRKSGGASQMRAIITAFEQGDDIDLDDPDEFNDIGAVTSVLKQYFRQLPSPLFTFDLYQQFLDATSLTDKGEKLEKFRTLLSKLPKENYATLKVLMHHLYRVKLNGSENLMTAKNLSVVFGPTLLRGPDVNAEILDMNSKNSAIEYIILNTELLFPKEISQRPDGFL